MTETSELRSALTGPVLLPADDGFAAEVAGSNLAIVHSADVAVGAASAADVVEAVRYATAHGLTVRVQATGHGAHAPITDGLLITTRRLDALSIDAAGRTATIGAGVSWGAVIDAAAAVGLAPVSGSSRQVGVVGYLTGGGLGPLARSHGFSSDYVRGFTVVTGAGELVEASADSNPELFWALRGGKTGLGIVTEVRLGLVELPGLYAGSLLFEEQHIETVVRGWIDYTADAPADVSTSLVAVRFPPIDAVPEPMRGKNFVGLRFAFPGDEAEGERLAAPLRALAPAVTDEIGPLPLDRVGAIHNDPEGASPAWSDGTLLSHVDQDFATAFLASAGPRARVPFIASELRHLGAAAAVDVPEGSAVGGRSGGFTFTVIGVPEPSLFATAMPEAAIRVYDSIRPWINPETTVNFGSGSLAGTPAWSPETAARLAAVRAQYDPAGVFGT
jgi:FAD/FMN-containing dehydrogenase